MCSWQRFCLILSGKSPLSLSISSVRSPEFPLDSYRPYFPSDQACSCSAQRTAAQRTAAVPLCLLSQHHQGQSFYMEDSFLSAWSWFLCSFICHQWHLIFLTAFVEDIVFLPVCIFGNFGKKPDDCSCMDWNVGLLVHLVCLHVCFCAGIMLLLLLCLCRITLDLVW